MFDKPKRLVDEKLLKSYQGRPCVVCAQPGVGHHIKSKGAGGPDADFNLMALCQTHHREIHDKGNSLFLMKYEHIKGYLQLKGWQVTDQSPGINLFHKDL